MKPDLHAAIATEVAGRLGWPDPEAVGRGAALPDDLEFVFVEGVGSRFLGNNLACMTHFPGYCLGRDASLGNLELPDREVLYRVGIWPEVPKHMEPEEPLYRLLRVQGISHAFDEMTFPKGSLYGAWLEDCYRETVMLSGLSAVEPLYERRIATIAGMALHFVQDYCVPQHRRNEMLRAHAETEAQASKVWHAMDTAKREALIVDCIEKASPWSARSICDGFMVQPTPRVSVWACRRRKVVRDIIVKGITCTAAVLRHLRPEGKP